MKLDPRVRTGGDLIELLRSAPITGQPTRKGSKALGLAVHLGNVRLCAPPPRGIYARLSRQPPLSVSILSPQPGCRTEHDRRVRKWEHQPAMGRKITTRLGMVGALLMSLTATSPAGQPGPNVRRGSLPPEEVQPVYSPDPADSWNRVFNVLFARTVRSRLSKEFAGAELLEPVQVEGFHEFFVSTSTFERIESGDRSIEPLDPFLVHIGSRSARQHVLFEPSFTKLKRALDDALRDRTRRSPLARALMQSDMWAAHDVLFATQTSDDVQREHKEELLDLLVRLVKKLALSTREIQELPDNYSDARLPFELFAEQGGWIEIEYLPDRAHDRAADYRRFTRVFLKPASSPADRHEWLNGLRKGHAERIEKLDAVALTVQLLLVDQHGVVVPTRLTYEVQVRSFLKGPTGKWSGTRLAVAELSRKALLEGQAGGLRPVEEQAPAYLPSAGNDYFFASAQDSLPAREAVLAPLRKRCESCHDEGVRKIFTFSVRVPVGLSARELKSTENEHALFVSQRKMQRTDFKELRRRWDR